MESERKALLLNHTATYDYLGARCCLLNGLIDPGYILSQQALEKMLKCYILVHNPGESFKKNSRYPLHDLNSLLQRLQDFSQLQFAKYDNLCFTLTKAYHSLRYPDNPHITTYGINTLSTKVIDEVDEMFIDLFVQLPVEDKTKCRIGLLGLILISNNARGIELFVKANKAYLSRINFFGKTLNWWEMSNAEREKHTNIEIKDIRIID